MAGFHGYLSGESEFQAYEIIEPLSVFRVSSGGGGGGGRGAEGR